jgi:ABC-type Fe3+-hydroxamate transport system substrate-binding protein
VADPSHSLLRQNLSAVKNGNVYTVPWAFNLHAPLVNSMAIDAALGVLNGESE